MIGDTYIASRHLMLGVTIFFLAFNADARTPGYDCLLKPHSIVEISTREEGVLETLEVKRGDTVYVDQVVARIESGVEEAAVRLARARAEMHATLDQRKTRQEYQQRQLQRIQELAKTGAAPQHELDRAKTEAIVAEQEYAEAQETMRLNRIELSRAEHALARRTIESPVDGVVTEIHTRPGESVERVTIVTIAEVDPINVEVILPAELWGRLAINDRAKVTPLLPNAETHDATLTIIDRVIDSASNTFGVVLEIPNPGLRITAGSPCDIAFDKLP